MNLETGKMARIELITLIDREVQRCIQYDLQMRKDDEMNIEVMNLLIALDRITINPLSKDKIAHIFGKASASLVEEKDFLTLNYFQICVLLYLINMRDDLTEWKIWLLNMIPNHFCVEDWKRHADSACLFLDLMVCPYITKPEKIKIMSKAIGCNNNTAGTRLRNLANCERWFFDWNRNRDFGQVLEKKRYHFTYG